MAALLHHFDVGKQIHQYLNTHVRAYDRLVRSREDYWTAPDDGKPGGRVLAVGKKMTFEKRIDEGLERIEITITGETRKIMGVETLVYRDREYLGGKLIEETKDYLAQDKEGNVWYFGDDVDNYENSRFKDHGGAWIAGVGGAKHRRTIPGRRAENPMIEAVLHARETANRPRTIADAASGLAGHVLEGWIRQWPEPCDQVLTRIHARDVASGSSVRHIGPANDAVLAAASPCNTWSI